MGQERFFVPELQLELDPSRRRATRKGKSVNFRGKTVAWDIASELVGWYDAYYPLDELRHSVWGTHVVADGTVWCAVSEARAFFHQIGIDIKHESNAGYVLAIFSETSGIPSPMTSGGQGPRVSMGGVESADQATGFALT